MVNCCCCQNITTDIPTLLGTYFRMDNLSTQVWAVSPLGNAYIVFCSIRNPGIHIFCLRRQVKIIQYIHIYIYVFQQAQEQRSGDGWCISGKIRSISKKLSEQLALKSTLFFINWIFSYTLWSKTSNKTTSGFDKPDTW